MRRLGKYIGTLVRKWGFGWRVGEVASVQINGRTVLGTQSVSVKNADLCIKAGYRIEVVWDFLKLQSSLEVKVAQQPRGGRTWWLLGASTPTRLSRKLSAHSDEERVGIIIGRLA